jgi:RimJ/RimL family protein N-acetyltransferase
MGLLLIAILNHETIIGFARLYPDDEHPLGRRAGNIGIALLPSFRSMGIGAIILRVLAACAIELEYDVLTANILESNVRSRRLFTGCGFKKVRCRNIYLDFINDHVNELYYEWKHCVRGR